MFGIKEIPDLGLGIWNTGSQIRYLKKNPVFEILDSKYRISKRKIKKINSVFEIPHSKYRISKKIEKKIN